MNALINFIFMPICFASGNVKYLWSTVIQIIFIWKPKYPSQVFMCMHVKIDNKLQKKSLKLNWKKNCFQQHFSVYWKVNVQQPLRNLHIILHQLLIQLVYWVIVMRKYLRICFLYLGVWVFDLSISMGFLLVLDYVQNCKIWMNSKTTGTRYLLLVKKWLR